MICCSKCGRRVPRSTLCSDLGIITLHWMSEHPIDYGRMHPESAPFMPNHPEYVA